MGDSPYEPLFDKARFDACVSDVCDVFKSKGATLLETWMALDALKSSCEGIMGDKAQALKEVYDAKRAD